MTACIGKRDGATGRGKGIREAPNRKEVALRRFYLFEEEMRLLDLVFDNADRTCHASLVVALPAPRLQQVRLIQRRHGQPFHSSRQILADVK